MFRKISLFVCHLWGIGLVAATVNFCAENHLPQANFSSRLQFTKELSEKEYAVDSKFKSLHCCAKGYLSIEWFKDGRAYPWPGDVSSFILYPESANQTVYTNSLRTSDAGNYTCRIHNSTDFRLHKTELRVFDQTSGYMETPLATYKPPEETLAALGSVSRLFCEAFVGHIDLPDAASEVKWGKKGGNNSFEAPHIEEMLVERENEVVGKYLLINNVNSSDFGTYYCTISNTGDQKIVMETTLKPLSFSATGCSGIFCQYSLLTIILILPVFLVLLAIGFLRLIGDDNFLSKVFIYKFIGCRKVSSKKERIVVLYHEYDHDFVEKYLLPIAVADGSVDLTLTKLRHDVPMSGETVTLCSKIGKIAAVLSKNLCPTWTIPEIQQTLERIMIPDKVFSVILLEELPEPFVLPNVVITSYNDPLIWNKVKKAFVPIKKNLSNHNRLSLASLAGNKVVEVHV